mgnify:CR=1 FL=1
MCAVYYHLCVVEDSTACVFFFQAEDGIRDLVRSRGLGDVYKRQAYRSPRNNNRLTIIDGHLRQGVAPNTLWPVLILDCLLYTSDAADERSSVDLGGRRIIKKKKNRRRQQREVHNNIMRD